METGNSYYGVIEKQGKQSRFEVDGRHAQSLEMAKLGAKRMAMVNGPCKVELFRREASYGASLVAEFTQAKFDPNGFYYHADDPDVPAHIREKYWPETLPA